jgi:hypothetical protein
LIIAFYIKQEFIRYTFGDYLAVMLIYCFIKSFTSIKPFIAAIITLVIAFIVEFLQLIDVLSMLNIQQNTFTKLVFGTTFSIEDLVAYTLGVLTIILIENSITKK